MLVRLPARKISSDFRMLARLLEPVGKGVASANFARESEPIEKIQWCTEKRGQYPPLKIHEKQAWKVKQANKKLKGQTGGCLKNESRKGTLNRR